MDLLNLKVRHKVFGSGIVTDVNGEYLTVQFESKEAKFVYPDAFENFLIAEDDAVQTFILGEVNLKKQAAAEERQAAEAPRKAEAERRLAKKQTALLTKNKKINERPKRIEGKRMVFFVFQGNTFNKEYNGGYIWAPVSDRAGNKPHHWERLLDVRQGDIILHGCDGYIKAISIAKTSCFDCSQPAELAVEELWDREGRRVDCDYTGIKNPIKTIEFKDDIIRLCQVKYAPFDKDGNGNMGYLFDINRELAKIFIKASVKQNKYLADIDYIVELLSEE